MSAIASRIGAGVGTVRRSGRSRETQGGPERGGEGQFGVRKWGFTVEWREAAVSAPEHKKKQSIDV